MELEKLDPNFGVAVPLRVRRGEVDIEVAATGLVDVFLTDSDGLREMRSGAAEFSYYRSWGRRRKVRVLASDLPRKPLFLIIMNRTDTPVTVALHPDGVR